MTTFVIIEVLTVSAYILSFAISVYRTDKKVKQMVKHQVGIKLDEVLRLASLDLKLKATKDTNISCVQHNMIVKKAILKIKNNL